MECRASGLPVNTSSRTSSEEELLLDEQSQLSLDEVYDQLEQMKQRAKSLRQLLIRERPKTAEYVKCLEVIEKKGSRNAEVRAVQLQTADLVNQVATLARRLKHERLQGNNLECYLQQNRMKTDKLYSRMEKLQKWPEKLENQTAMCLDRYQELSISCIDLTEFSSFIRRIYESFTHTARNKTPLGCYQVVHHNVAKRLENMWQMMHAAFKYLLRNSNELTLALNKHRHLEHFSLAARSMPQSTVSQYESDEDSTESSSLLLPL
ncbi:uncharacterized protein LOC117786748 [Drosophila innubila]|uniref:uncharacterized protein LOC117786748 n=1 Tax=Drosophila innubila TaxID=198719 RepID=UPI00148BDC4B|nr:uncharacterized protein LOC117786748 [Drosophila innubila]